MGEKLASEIGLFQKSCEVLIQETGREPASLGVVRDLALHTAQSIMDAFRVYPEAMDRFSWDRLMQFAHELVLLAVKGWYDHQGEVWFATKVQELAKEAKAVAELL